MEGVRRHICASSTHTPPVRFSTSSCRILRELVIGICRSAIGVFSYYLFAISRDYLSEGCPITQAVSENYNWYKRIPLVTQSVIKKLLLENSSTSKSIRNTNVVRAKAWIYVIDFFTVLKLRFRRLFPSILYHKLRIPTVMSRISKDNK